jgi:multiple sugar transport system permease protein
VPMLGAARRRWRGRTGARGRDAAPPLDERARRERRLGWLLTAPAVTVMLAVTAWPMLSALWLSLYSYRLTDPSGRELVGLRNYAVVLRDALWWRDVATTTLLAAVTVAAELVLGLAFAIVMHRATTGRRWVRTAVLVPYGTVTVVSAFAWRHAFALDTGFVNGWLGLGDFAWFGHRASSLLAIAVCEVWKTTPFVSLLLLAGLAQVPEELQEAARVDGASRWQRLWRVTLPNMKGTILVAVLFRTLDAWRVFDSIFVMTGGAEDTETVSFLAYRQMIGRTSLGLGAAVSVLLFLSVLLIAALYLRAFRLDLSSLRGEP